MNHLYKVNSNPEFGVSGSVTQAESTKDRIPVLLSGSGSVVEHWLPKPGTAGSNPVFRSSIVKKMPETQCLIGGRAFLFVPGAWG